MGDSSNKGREKRKMIIARTWEEIRIVMKRIIVFIEHFQADGKPHMFIIIIKLIYNSLSG